MTRSTDGIRRLGEAIPGFSGYDEQVWRRENDRQVRARITETLEGWKALVDTEVGRAMKRGRLECLEPLDGLRRALDRTADLTRHAPEGHGSFFAASRIGSEILDLIIENDVAILEGLEFLELRVGRLESADDPEALCRQIGEDLEAIERELTRRDEIMSRGY